MAALLDMTRTAEPSLIIKLGGLPAAWRWRGRMYDVAVLHTQWQDEAGGDWYRVESTEGLIFLLGLQPKGWVAVLWPAPSQRQTLLAIQSRAALSVIGVDSNPG